MYLLTSKDALAQVLLLMASDYEALGFLPRQEVDDAFREGRVILQREGKEVYGYLLHGVVRPGGTVVVKQACVDVAARRMGAGREAVWQLIGKATKGMAHRIRLRCAEDLPSNWFWLAMGCRHVGTLHPPNIRKRAINVYEFNLMDDLLTPSDMPRLWLPG